MKEEKWFGINRKTIDWFPTIDYDICNGCMVCVQCNHDVFSKEDDKPVVSNNNNCIVGCTACAIVCPEDAIKLPPKEYLRRIARHRNSSCSCC